MAYRVELAARAIRDPSLIYTRICADDSDRAASWFNGLEAMVYSLNTHPARGVKTPESHQLLYGDKPHVYRIIYRLAERSKRITFLHIRHAAPLQDHNCEDAPGAVRPLQAFAALLSESTRS